MEQTVEQKLKALYRTTKLSTQKLIKFARLEVNYTYGSYDPLKMMLQASKPAYKKIKAELDDLGRMILFTRKNLIKDALANIKKYETQLNEVKNNREYDAISKRKLRYRGLEYPGERREKDQGIWL